MAKAIKKKHCKSKKIKVKYTALDSIIDNYLSWIVIFISIYIISYHFFKGVITFLFTLFLAYFIHLYSHKILNVFTILHHYHHSNNNFFSHFNQCILELLSPIVFLPFCL